MSVITTMRGRGVKGSTYFEAAPAVGPPWTPAGAATSDTRPQAATAHTPAAAMRHPS